MPEGTNHTSTNPTGTNPPAGQQASAEPQSPDTGRTFTQDDVNRLLAGERRTQEQRFADAVAKAAQFDDLESKNKTDLQRATERGDNLEKELASEKAARLRLEVAQDKKLPAEFAARLQGTTKEELEADADALAKLLPPGPPASNSFRDTQGKPAQQASGDWLRDSLANR